MEFAIFDEVVNNFGRSEDDMILEKYLKIRSFLPNSHKKSLTDLCT